MTKIFTFRRSPNIESNNNMCRLSYDDRKAKSIVVARKQVYGEDNSNKKYLEMEKGENVSKDKKMFQNS